MLEDSNPAKQTAAAGGGGRSGAARRLVQACPNTRGLALPQNQYCLTNPLGLDHQAITSSFALHTRGWMTGDVDIKSLSHLTRSTNPR